MSRAGWISGRILCAVLMIPLAVIEAAVETKNPWKLGKAAVKIYLGALKETTVR